MIYELVPHTDSILHTKLETFDFMNPPTDSIKLAKDMAESMHHYKGIGLAANQLGLPYRVFVMRTNPILTCFNPRIVNQSEVKSKMLEGCLTYPALVLNIERPDNIKVRFTLPNGEVRTETFAGLTSRIFQHELDHLDGLLFTKKVTRLELERAQNKARKLLKFGRKYEAGDLLREEVGL